MMTNQTQSSQYDFQQELADAQYALNRAMTAAQDLGLYGFAQQLVQARDEIWAQRQALDPTLKD
jgi:lysozyme family protein